MSSNPVKNHINTLYGPGEYTITVELGPDTQDVVLHMARNSDGLEDRIPLQNMAPTEFVESFRRAVLTGRIPEQHPLVVEE